MIQIFQPFEKLFFAFGGEEFSKLPSKNKVADEKMLGQSNKFEISKYLKLSL